MQTDKSLIRKLFCCGIAMLLAVCICFVPSAQIIAKSTEEPEYIGEMRIFTASTEREAAAKAEKEGYIYVPGNLNASTSYNAVVLGYKTTTDRNKAITDVTMAQMQSGYRMVSYGDIARKQAEKLTGVTEELMVAVKEYTDNLSKGSPAAQEAKTLLNFYRVDEQNNMLLGDYLASGKCTADFLSKLISRANSSVISAVYNALAAGTADCDDSNWAQRITANGIQEKIASGDFDKELDTDYKEIAIEIYPSLQQFTEKYENASARAAFSKNEALAEPGSKEIADIPEETMERINEGEQLDESDGDAFYLAVYDLLNCYDYDENTKLGDYIVEAGRKTYSGKEELRFIYPLVDAVTNGQAAIIRIAGISPVALYLENSDALLETAQKYFDEIKDKIRDCGEKDALSVWAGTDQSIYDKRVAITDELERYSQAGARYVDLTKESAFDTALSEIMNIINFAGLVISIAYCTTILSVNFITWYANFAIWAGTATTWTVCASAIGSSVLGSILGVLGCAAIIASYVILAAIAVILLVMFVKWIVDLCSDDNEKYTEMPASIYDLDGSFCLRYDLVGNGKSSADLNAENGKKWNALYFSHDENAGDPLTPDSLDNAFRVQIGDSTIPTGYTPVKNFGETAAANLNANVRQSSAKGIFLFFHTEGRTVEENDGTDETEPDSEYLLKLILATEKTENAAKAFIVKKGYKTLDYNLTPMSGIFTYIGYQTTTIASKALTDIRISPQNSSSPFLFGDSSYTCCATTPTGDGLYYTSYPGAGSPILADIQVVDRLKDANVGFEPVNPFGGGPAYNFNNGDDLSRNKATSSDQFNAPGRYVFFHPGVTYTEGTQYVSGFVIVSGVKADDNKNFLKNYINSLGLTKYDSNLTSSLDATHSFSFSEGLYYYKSLDDLETYICYSLTYNPYRAITDVQTFISTPSDKTVPSNLGSAVRGGFSVCDIMYQLPYEPHAGGDMDEFYRGYYQSHSYICPGPAPILNYDSGKMVPDNFENVSWKESSLRAKGLYVCGHCEGKSPLTADDIIVSSSTVDREGFVSIQDVRNPNSTQPHNLAVSTLKKPCTVYMYIRKNIEQKKYIAAVTVVTYDLYNMMGEQDYSKLEDDQIEEIDKTADDICIKSLAATCSDEIINLNFAAPRSTTYLEDYENNNTTCSYIGISRTSDASKALHGLLKYESYSSIAPAQMTVDGVKYTRCGDKVKDLAGSYWIYSAVSDGAIPGEPITDIDFGTSPIVRGAATVLSTKFSLATENIVSPYGSTKGNYYIHTHFEDKGLYISTLYIGHGKTKELAQCDLLSQGCCIAIDRNLNDKSGGEYVCIGYSKYAPKKTDKNAKYAIRDIIMTTGEKPCSELEYNGIKYMPVCGSDGKPKSLNSGNNGDEIYLYCTTYFSSDQNKDLLSYSPIIKLGVSERDRVPDNEDTFIWEYAFTTQGRKCNLNSGVISVKNDEDFIVDCRMYLFANRADNSVVPERKITGGHCAESVDYGTMIKG